MSVYQRTVQDDTLREVSAVTCYIRERILKAYPASALVLQLRKVDDSTHYSADKQNNGDLIVNNYLGYLILQEIFRQVSRRWLTESSVHAPLARCGTLSPCFLYRPHSSEDRLADDHDFNSTCTIDFACIWM